MEPPRGIWDLQDMEQPFATVKGEILHITAVNLGHNTNNAVEIWGLLKGLQVAKEQGISLLIVEGDSQIVINLLSHLLNGVDPEKISPSWRLMNRLIKIKSILQPQWVILPSHVRRQANQVEDMLENFGVDLQEGDFSCSPSLFSYPPLRDRLQKYGSQQGPTPGWGVSVSTHGQPQGRPPRQTSCHLEPAQTYPPSTVTSCIKPPVIIPRLSLDSTYCKHLTFFFMGILMGMGWTNPSPITSS
jgi:ribonuclease HI